MTGTLEMGHGWDYIHICARNRANGMYIDGMNRVKLLGRQQRGSLSAALNMEQNSAVI